MRKLPILAIGLFVAVGCTSRSGIAEGSDTSDSAEFGFATVEVAEGANNKEDDSPFESETPDASGRPWCRNVGPYDEIFNDSNYIQYASAERLGIDPMYELSQSYHTRRPLVKIESNDNFQLDRLTHSMPFLVPEAATLLNEIGHDFSTLLEKRGGNPKTNKIIVTSLLRSPYSVKKLRKVNKNAVDSSTHMFATTFDIAWNNFHYTDSLSSVDAGVLKGILAEVLLRKRNQGKCWVKYEKKTPCFHITVK